MNKIINFFTKIMLTGMLIMVGGSMIGCTIKICNCGTKEKTFKHKQTFQTGQPVNVEADLGDIIPGK